MDAEKNYSTIEREALAKWGLQNQGTKMKIVIPQVAIS